MPAMPVSDAIPSVCCEPNTAGRIIELVRALKPGVKVVVGGYDPSFAREAYMEMNVDYIVRGEGEITFRDDYFCVARHPTANSGKRQRNPHPAVLPLTCRFCLLPDVLKKQPIFSKSR